MEDWNPRSKKKKPDGMPRNKPGRKGISKEKILQEALSAVKENNLFSLSDINPYIPCHYSTLLACYPKGSDGYSLLEEACADNKVKRKKETEKLMMESKAPACLAMMWRIVATPEERNTINQGYIETAKDGKATPITSITIVRGES